MGVEYDHIHNTCCLKPVCEASLLLFEFFQKHCMDMYIACNHALQLACSLTLSFPHSCDSIERGDSCQRRKCEFDHGVQFIGLELFSDLSLGFSVFFLFFHILNMKCYKNELSYNLKTALQLPGNISYFDYYVFVFVVMLF